MGNVLIPDVRFFLVATVASYTHPRSRAYPGEGYDGVVRIRTGDASGTGALLFDGCAILTAAHLVAPNGMVLGANTLSVLFESLSGSSSLAVREIEVHPWYDPASGNHDLALVWLSSPPPNNADRYELYRQTDEIGRAMELVGYGTPGTGATGMISSYSASPLRLKGQNTFDTESGLLTSVLQQGMAWTPEPQSQLIADFDNGTAAHDALGGLLGIHDLGLSIYEAMITPGDSGGPAFIDGRIAGVASYGASLWSSVFDPDVDRDTNGSFGELGFWQRVSYYQSWIDGEMRERYPDAPRSAAEVVFNIPEGNSGTSMAYFFVEFHGIRSNPDEWLSVDFATRNGSATAGSDYIATSGTLILYPQENSAVIPVEIIGDSVYEPDESFYLDIFNPVGGTFPSGVELLSAMRTIVNDDWM